jgi:hypothetical protein
MYTHPFLDLDSLNKDLEENKISATNKLPYIYEKMGGEFYNSEKKILKSARAAIVGIGGLPLEVKNGELFLLDKKTDVSEIKKALFKTLGASAFMSYLNPRRRDLESLANGTLSRGHNSIKHTLFFNILLVGHSIGVEHELSSQRDLIHLSRLTVAATKAQDDPCLTLLNGEQVELYENILKSTNKYLSEAKIPMLEETRNLLFPTAKSSMIMLSGSWRNFEKLISLKDSDGKEFELCQILKDIEELFNWLY